MKTKIEAFKRWCKNVNDMGTLYYNAPYRAAIARAKRDEDDVFMMLVFSEMMGIPNPAAWYTLELQPLLMERFHQWHVRMGMPRSPLDQFRCC